MRARQLSLTACVLLLLSALASGAVAHGTAAPEGSALAGPCLPGDSYDPACDVDRDGAISVTDIQLTAGHWQQTGAWTGDNSHDHLEQTWTGTDNPLKIEGSFGAPDYAPLVLSNGYRHGLMISANWHGVVVDSVGVTGVLVNSAGFDGVAVGSAGWHGLEVGSAHGDGVLVGSAGDDGLFVAKTGSAAAYVGSANHNGVEIGNAEHDAVYVDSAGDDGLRVCRTGSATSCSYNTLDNGVEIGNAAGDGVLVLAAGYNGVWAHTTRPGHDYGFYTLDRIYAGTTLLQSLSLVAQVDGPDALTPGDLVAAAGLADPLPGSPLHVPLVRLADGKSLGVVGVVETRLALEQAGELLPADDGSAPVEPLPPELHSADGPAQPGDYVAITIYGAAQVKVDGAAAIEAGQRLTASSTPGQARALRALKVQLADGAGAADMLETAPVIGVALDAPRNGLAWVLVNPQ